MVCVCVVRQAPVVCVMAPPIHLGAWSMAIMYNYYPHRSAGGEGAEG